MRLAVQTQGADKPSFHLLWSSRLMDKLPPPLTSRCLSADVSSSGFALRDSMFSVLGVVRLNHQTHKDPAYPPTIGPARVHAVEWTATGILFSTRGAF